MYLGFGRESVSWWASCNSHLSLVFRAVLIRCGWRLVGWETVSLERVSLEERGFLDFFFLCSVNGRLVGRVAYLASMSDLEDNISTFIQCFFYHFSDN